MKSWTDSAMRWPGRARSICRDARPASTAMAGSRSPRGRWVACSDQGQRPRTAATQPPWPRGRPTEPGAGDRPPGAAAPWPARRPASRTVSTASCHHQPASTPTGQQQHDQVAQGDQAGGPHRDAGVGDQCAEAPAPGSPRPARPAAGSAAGRTAAPAATQQDQRSHRAAAGLVAGSAGDRPRPALDCHQSGTGCTAADRARRPNARPVRGPMPRSLLRSSARQVAVPAGELLDERAAPAAARRAGPMISPPVASARPRARCLPDRR